MRAIPARFVTQLDESVRSGLLNSLLPRIGVGRFSGNNVIIRFLPATSNESPYHFKQPIAVALLAPYRYAPRRRRHRHRIPRSNPFPTLPALLTPIFCEVAHFHRCLFDQTRRILAPSITKCLGGALSKAGNTSSAPETCRIFSIKAANLPFCD